MSKLKLFVSHSSRLDDVEHKYTRDDHNWALLEDTCKAILRKYGNRVEVLVDQEGLIPGERWNHQINLWLAECHVAIILFSKRAIDKSDWVAKEAAILSWRAELNDKFKLIPVLLDGESTPEDLEKDFYGVLKIDQSQCIRNATSAEDILAGIVQQLGERDDLATAYPQTPLESLQGGIAKLLSERTTTASLQASLEALKCPVAPNRLLDHGYYADLLARRFVESSGQNHDCFGSLMRGIDPLVPPPISEEASYLYRSVRSLWVDPGAAAHLPKAVRERAALVMSGRLVTYGDNVLSKRAYTLERYLERAWPTSTLYCLVTLTSIRTLSGVKDEIRKTILGENMPSFIPPEALDREINEDDRTIVLVVPARPDEGDLPDPIQLRELVQTLLNDYRRLALVFAVERVGEGIPDTLRPVEPPLDLEREQKAYLAERRVRTYLDEKYGTGR